MLAMIYPTIPKVKQAIINPIIIPTKTKKDCLMRLSMNIMCKNQVGIGNISHLMIAAHIRKKNSTPTIKPAKKSLVLVMF